MVDLLIKNKLVALRKEIYYYRREREELSSNYSYKEWLNGLILGLQRAECILIELEEEHARWITDQKQEDTSASSR